MEVVLKNVTAGVISVDMQGIFTTMNKSAENLLQLSSSAIVGKHFSEVLDRQTLIHYQRVHGGTPLVGQGFPPEAGYRPYPQR